MKQINTPHNNFFIQVLSRKDKGTAFLSKNLPKSMLPIASLKQTEIIESKHMSDTGRSLYNDIIYGCPLDQGKRGYLICPIEHQSTPEKHMPLRLGKYKLAIIDARVKQGSKQAPVVVHIVLYTGARPWNYSTAFTDYYADPSLGSQYFYMAPFILVQLPEGDNKEDPVYLDEDLGFFFAAFYCGRSQDPYAEFEEFKQIPEFRQHFNSLPLSLRRIVGNYLSACINRKSYNLEKIVNLVIINDQEKEEFMQTVAQEYIDQGLQKGQQETTQAIARRMFRELHLDMDTIQKATGLTKDELQKML
jgi:predicted transposase YdaD